MSILLALRSKELWCVLHLENVSYTEEASEIVAKYSNLKPYHTNSEGLKECMYMYK